MLMFFESLPPCLIGMEACATAHHWARELRAFGHEVRLMPAHYVKAYVKRGKNDAADAEAICEAVVMHRARDLLVRQRTQLVNALRGLMAEFGVSEPRGIRHVGRLRAHLDEDVVPKTGRDVLRLLVDQLDPLEKQIAEIERKIREWHRTNPISQRLARIPGVGPLIATAVVATVGDASLFRSGREFAACLVSLLDRDPPVASNASAGSRIRVMPTSDGC